MTGAAPQKRAGARDSATDFLTVLFREPLDPGYARAARRQADAVPRPRWRVRSARGIRLLVLVLIGFLLMTAYQHAVAATPGTTKAHERLVSDVKARRAQTDELQQQADRLREDVVRARDEALADSDEARRLHDLAAAIGLAGVHGDGIVVRLADGPAQPDPVTGQAAASNPGRVLDRDLQDIANALWHGGAEAIAINGQRLTATSTIRAAGAVILVDFAPVTGPYQVSAIGPDDLDKTFGDSATARRFRSYVDVYRMQFSVRKQEGMTLPAAAEPQLRYARPPGASPEPSASAVLSPSGGTT